jgi:hypothetical protein
MDPATKATIVRLAGTALSAVLRMRLAERKQEMQVVEEHPFTAPDIKVFDIPTVQPAPQRVPSVALPTHEETANELKRRLGRELYKAELDLAAGLKIAGKPCTCLESKHTLELEAGAEELIPEDPGNPVYREIISWIDDNQHKVTPEAIASGKYDTEYPKMAAEFRDFRKRVMGTVGTAPPAAKGKPIPKMTLQEAQQIAAEQAAEEVAKRWPSLEKK